MLDCTNYMVSFFCHCDESEHFSSETEETFPVAVGNYGVFTLLTATAFAATPAEEENGFSDFLLGKKYTYSMLP